MESGVKQGCPESYVIQYILNESRKRNKLKEL